MEEYGGIAIGKVRPFIAVDCAYMVCSRRALPGLTVAALKKFWGWTICLVVASTIALGGYTADCLASSKYDLFYGGNLAAGDGLNAGVFVVGAHYSCRDVACGGKGLTLGIQGGDRTRAYGELGGAIGLMFVTFYLALGVRGGPEQSATFQSTFAAGFGPFQAYVRAMPWARKGKGEVGLALVLPWP